MFPAHGVALKDYRWPWFWLVLSISAFFSFHGGFVNAVAFLGVTHTGLSHMTGVTTNSAIRVINPAKPGQITEIEFFMYLFGFFFGGGVGGFILKTPRLRWGRLQGLVVLYMGAALFVGWYWSSTHSMICGSLVASAMGAQNSIMTLFAGMALRNTHMTGHVLDLGIATGQCLRNLNLDNFWKIKVNFPTYAGFWVGALVGTYAYNELLMDALLWPCFVYLTVGGLTIPLVTLWKLYIQGRPDPAEQVVQMEPAYNAIGDEDEDEDDKNGQNHIPMATIKQSSGSTKG